MNKLHSNVDFVVKIKLHSTWTIINIYLAITISTFKTEAIQLLNMNCELY